MSAKQLVAEKIRKARRDTGLTQKQFAAKIGMAGSTLGLYETAERSPDYDVLQRISEATGHPMSWFFGETEGAASGAASVSSIMSVLAVRVCAGVATVDEKERLLQLAAQHIAPVVDVKDSLRSCSNLLTDEACDEMGPEAVSSLDRLREAILGRNSHA